MARPRTGSAFERKGKVWLQVTLRADVRASTGKRIWQGECPPRKGGVPVDLVHARAIARDLQREHDEGRWDPFAIAAPEPATEGPPTLAAFARGWAKGLTYESAPKDRRAIENHLEPSDLGATPVPELRPRHVLAFLGWLAARPSSRGGSLAARTVRNVYDVVRRALDAAVVAELLVANPCAPVHGKLPAIEDKHPEARDGWFFGRAEVWQLITDTRVQAARRVVYALEFCTGCRPGEFAVLRWRDWDREQAPLTRLTITRAMKSVSRKIGRTKTSARKFVPVHPHLAGVLAAWWSQGWAAFMGRAPEPDDLIVPNQDGNPRNTNRANRDFKRDTKRLGLGEERHHYCTRHTFVTQVQDDGADGAVIQWVTHAPPKTAFNGYTRAQWTRLCAELAKFRVGPPFAGLADGLTDDPAETHDHQ